MGGGRADAHVGTGLGDDHLRRSYLNAGDGADQLSEDTKGLHHHLQPSGQISDGLAALVDGVEIHRAKKARWSLNRAGQHLDQLVASSRLEALEVGPTSRL